jgi:hypothetical protein
MMPGSTFDSYSEGGKVMKSIKLWYESKDNELNYEISIYDHENDLIERYNVSSQQEKDDIIKSHYHNNDDAGYYEVFESKISEKALKGRPKI